MMENNEQMLEEKKKLVDTIEVEGYSNCSGAEDYRCDHDCIFFHNAVISKVE